MAQGRPKQNEPEEREPGEEELELVKMYQGKLYVEVHTASSCNHAQNVPVCHSSDKSHAISAVEEPERRQGKETEDE